MNDNVDATNDTLLPTSSTTLSTTTVTSRILTTNTTVRISTSDHPHQPVKRLKTTSKGKKDNASSSTPTHTNTTEISTPQHQQQLPPAVSSSDVLESVSFRESPSLTLIRLGIKKYLCGAGNSYKIFARIYPQTCYMLYKSFSINITSNASNVNDMPSMMPYLRCLDIYANLISSRYHNSFNYKFTVETSGIITCCMPRFLVARKSSKSSFPNYVPITDAFSKAFLVDQITKKIANCKFVKFVTTDITRYFTYASKTSIHATNHHLLVNEEKVISHSNMSPSTTAMTNEDNDDDISLILFQPVFIDNETIVCIVESDIKL
jgi:hypothetical protein